MRYLGCSQSLKRVLGILLPACKCGLEQQPVVGGDAHGLHQLRHVVHVEHVDYVAAEAVADDGGGVGFKCLASALNNKRHVWDRQVGQRKWRWGSRRVLGGSTA